MGRLRYCFFKFWCLLDPIYYLCSRLEYVRDKENNRDIFRVRLTKYKGRQIILSDGTKIKKNDLLLKIHLHNVYLMKELNRFKSEIQKGRYIYSKTEKGLPNIVQYLRNHSQFHNVKGIIGITILNKGSERLGFETFAIQNPFYKWYKLLTFTPMYLIIQYCFDSLKRPPKYLMMSKEKLLKLYG